MARILKLVFLLIISQVALGQAPSNYTNINGRYRWIAGMFDSTFHIPKGTTPSLRTGGSTNAGALFYKTGDSSLYVYSGTQWLKIAGASGFVPYTGATQNVNLNIYSLLAKSLAIADTSGVGADIQQRTSLNTDIALNVKATGNRGYAAIIDQADSVAAGTQYLTLFRKSMMAGTGNPAPGAGVSWYTQIGNDNNQFTATSVYRSRIIDTTGFSGSGAKSTSIELWTRKNNAFDTTLVLNAGNVGVNTGQNGIDSSLTVANGTWLKRGVRMSALPSGVGTKTLRIDANGNVSVADTNTLTGYVPYVGATQDVDLDTWSAYAKSFHVKGTGGNGHLGLKFQSATPNMSANESGVYADASGNLGVKINNSYTSIFKTSLNSADRTYTLQNKSYTIGDSADIAARVKYTDTASMLSPYLRSNVAAATYVPLARSLTINGTTQDLSANRTYNVGTVTSVATSTGTGITGGTITSSGTIAADTLLLSTRAWRQKGVDSVAALVSGAVSGTTNYIPKFTSSSAIGNSTLQEVNGNIGLNRTPSTFTTGKAIELNTAGNIVWGLGAGSLQLGSNYYYDNAYLYANNGASARYDLGSNAGQHIWFTAPSGTTGGTITWAEQMRLTSTGLGIGTSSPAYKLDVLGSGRFGNVSNNTEAITFLDGLNTKTHIGSGFGATFIQNNTYYNGSAYVYDDNTLPSSVITLSSGEFNVQTGAANTSPTTKLKLDNSGNLGLGVSPSAWGAGQRAIQFGSRGIISNNSAGTYSNFGNNAYFDGTNWVYLATGTAGLLQMEGNNYYWQQAASGTAGNAISFTQAMTLDASGNLLVGGTSSNGNRLQVTGSGTFTGSVNAGSGIENASINAGYLQFYNAASSNKWIKLADDASTINAIGFSKSGSTATTWFPSGNVGIGTTSPTVKLQVDNNTHNYFQLNSTVANVQTSISAQNTASGNRATLAWEDGTRGAYGDLYASTFLTLSTGAGEKARLTNAGELLINTTSDAGDYKLQVNGKSWFNNDMTITNSSNAILKLANTTSSKDWILQSYSDGNFYMGVNGAFNSLWFDGTSGAATFYSSIKTAAPSGGSAQPYKWGSIVASSVTIDPDNYVDVEINGVSYKLALAIPSEPEPSPDGYVPYYGPVQSKRVPSAQEKIKDLEKEIAELKELIKSKIK